MPASFTARYSETAFQMQGQIAGEAEVIGELSFGNPYTAGGEVVDATTLAGVPDVEAVNSVGALGFSRDGTLCASWDPVNSKLIAYNTADGLEASGDLSADGKLIQVSVRVKRAI